MLLTRKDVRVSILYSVAVEAGTLESNRVILFFSQPTEFVFQVRVTGFRVKLTKFPYAGAKVFSLDFSHATGNGFENCIMDENVLRLMTKKQQQKTKTKEQKPQNSVERSMYMEFDPYNK